MAVDLRAYEKYCAYLNGELAGFINVKFGGITVEVLWLAVRREFQGRGMDTALLGFAEELVGVAALG
jgi:ribosomal protein S18 acetylase RimI-like enzyme